MFVADTGPIPNELYQLTQLKELYVSCNGLTGGYDEWSQTFLLSASQTYVGYIAYTTGPVSPDIGSLTKLNMLFLSHNQFTGWTITL